AIRTSPRRPTNQAKTYTYSQPAIKKLACAPGSILDRHGGSDLDRRRQLDAMVDLGDRRSAALQQSESFRGVRLAAPA
ncbi:MAG: hypothetical protein O9321_19160, partial [Rubrivivax sp.]|nr:hypothetical protein [Rubrivivax sp.]